MRRGVYLWAGTATIQMQRIKFPDIAIDEDAHWHAHTPVAAAELARRGVNLAFLSMNWGFPPEIEQQHWQEFADAVRVYQDVGIDVMGYVQSSNCVKQGSYGNKDWYAVSPEGFDIPYFPNRLMTCWNHPEWVETVEQNAIRVIRAGARGVYFDNVWMGATPWILGGVGGFAGCYCNRCRTRFRQESGENVPRRLNGSAVDDHYLSWRAKVVAERIQQWSAAIRAISDSAQVMLNNCDVVLRDTRAMFGLDPVLLAPHQDAILIENIAMPAAGPRRLVANALPLKAMRVLAGGKPVLSVSYEQGIGLDGPPSATRVRRFIAEVAAVGAHPILKASEYLDDRGRFSVITAPAFDASREAAGQMLNWLRDHASLLTSCDPDPDVVLDLRWQDGWYRGIRPRLLEALALVRAQVPFAFAVASSIPRREHAATRYARHLTTLAADAALKRFSRAYFGRAQFRRRIDRSGVTAAFLRSHLFDLPDGWQVLESSRYAHKPHAKSQHAILVERWHKQNGDSQLRLVNYTDAPVEVVLSGLEDARLYSPDPATEWLDNDHRTLKLDCFALVEGAASGP